MAKFWSLLLAFLLSGLPLRFDVNTDRPRYLITEGIHEPDECVPRSYGVFIVETDRAIYRIEKYDQVWDWTVARSEAIAVALRLDYTFDTIANYCGDSGDKKTRVEVLSMANDDPLLERPYVTRDTAVLTFQHIRNTDYVEALTRAYLSAYPTWVAFGIAGVVNGNLLDESFLVDYFLMEDTELLRLSGIRFSEEICGAYEVAVAKGVATSLIRFIKKQCYYNTLLEVIQTGDIGAIKQAWLESIGTDLPYQFAEEETWHSARLFQNAWVPMLIEIEDLLFEFHVGDGYWKNDQTAEPIKSADALERMVAISAATQKNVQNVLKDVPGADLNKGTIQYIVDPYLLSRAQTSPLNKNIYPYVLDAFAYLPNTVEPFADDLERGTLPYAVANGLSHIYLNTSPDWYQQGQWLQRGVAAYIAMTLPRMGNFSQNLDSAYEALLAAASGEYPAIDGFVPDGVAGYYDMIVDCYLEMGGSLADASAFDPILYTNAAAYARMRDMESAQTWDDFQILQGKPTDASRASIPPDEMITSFVCYLIDEASLRELIGVLKSDAWEAVYGRTYDRLFDDWKASLPYVMATKNDWMGIR